MTSTWTVTYERKADGGTGRKTITVEAEFMVEAIVKGRVVMHKNGDGLDWSPIEAKCV